MNSELFTDEKNAGYLLDKNIWKPLEEKNAECSPDKNDPNSLDKAKAQISLDKKDARVSPRKKNVIVSLDKKSAVVSPKKKNAGVSPDKKNAEGSFKKTNAPSSPRMKNPEYSPDKKAGGSLDREDEVSLHKKNTGGSLDENKVLVSPQKKNAGDYPDKKNTRDPTSKKFIMDAPHKKNAGGTPDKNARTSVDENNFVISPDEKKIEDSPLKKNAGCSPNNRNAGSSEDKVNGTNSATQNFQLPTQILDDLCSRFIINIPIPSRKDLVRIFHYIEQAHWFYIDFYLPLDLDLKGISIFDFSYQIFKHAPMLSQHIDRFNEHYVSWRKYKLAIPTYGAILLDESCQHCLLVQGYNSGKSWGFPKGKVNEEERPHMCARREVLEETGFDISELIDKDEYIDYTFNKQYSRLYIIHGVSMKTTMFQPRVRREIKDLQWFRVEYLPSTKDDTICQEMYDLKARNFFLVIPYVRALRRWIAKKLRQGGKRKVDSEKIGLGEVGTAGILYSQIDQELRGRWEMGPEGPTYTQAEEDVVLMDENRTSQQDHFSHIHEECDIYQQLYGQSEQAQNDQRCSFKQQSYQTMEIVDEKNNRNVPIVKNDGLINVSVGKSSRRSLACSFDATTIPSNRQEDEVKLSGSWVNFTFDAESILSAMNLV